MTANIVNQYDLKVVQELQRARHFNGAAGRNHVNEKKISSLKLDLKGFKDLQHPQCTAQLSGYLTAAQKGWPEPNKYEIPSLLQPNKTRMYNLSKCGDLQDS